MKAAIEIALFPTMGAAGCGCSCGPVKTQNAEAVAVVRAVERTLGDSVHVMVADYSTSDKVRAAAGALQEVIKAAGMNVPPVTAKNLRFMLETAGPFLAVGGVLVASGRLPDEEELRDFVAQKAADAG